MGDSKFTTNCISCRVPDQKENQRTIYHDKLCRVVLRTDNQCWLGRYVIVPRKHLDPLDFWTDEIMQHIMSVHVKCSRGIIKTLGATCVQMAQLGGLTVDENGNATTNQQYQHAHIHGIPRYEKAPTFDGKQWPDPQFKQGTMFSPLNIDPAAGLSKVVPSDSQVEQLAQLLRQSIERSDDNDDIKANL